MRHSFPAIVVLLIVLAFPAPLALAQHAAHSATTPTDVIDGAKTPTLIPDSTAWRLWLIAVTAEDTGNPQLSEPKRRAFLRQAGVGDTNMAGALEALAQFKTEYAAMIANYNQHVSAGENPALTDFVAQREALVENIQAILAAKLDVLSAANLKNHIQAEKAHMKIAREVQ